MRNGLPMLSRPPVVATPSQSDHPKAIPSIRLISATPSASGNSSTASASGVFSADNSWTSGPSPLAPKADSPATRKRLVPKKSKLSLLGVSAGKDKGKDFSDVVRRVGGASISTPASHLGGGFEIYVDPTEDADIGEIVMIKKKKSRAALDGMRWGPGVLGEVTNVPATTPKEAPALLKVKAEEKDKWWSIGRGRKDSKEKAKEVKEVPKAKGRAKSPTPASAAPTVRDPYPRSKTPEPLKLTQEPSRARFNSLDSGILLNTPVNMGPFSNVEDLPAAEPSPPLTYSRTGTPMAGGLLAPPSALGTNTSTNQGSIAIRAMRSVRSLARIGSWAQLKNEEGGSIAVRGGKVLKEKAPKEKEVKEGKKKKEKKEGEKTVGVEEGKKKKKTKKEKEKDSKDTLKAQSIRLSTSSFEVGAASPQPPRTLGKKKHSILGLGLPSTMGSMTMRLPTVRNGSTASSSMPPVTNRLSVESAGMTMGRDRAGSVMSTSTASSLRPMSTTSSMTGSRLSSGSSVRWDEDCLENVKELRRKERREKEDVRRKESVELDSKGKTKERESRRSSEGRKRTPISEVFPDVRPESPAPMRRLPILQVEAATADGHSAPDDCVSLLEEDEEEQLPLETPIKKARARPVSEQLLGRTRPKAMYENEDGVLSILDAATNDLAQLINNLDLEATPATPDITPLKPSHGLLSASQSRDASPSDSPTRNKANHLSGSPLKQGKGLYVNMPSISSLRPYAQSRKNLKGPAEPSPASEMIGLQIAPWPTLLQGLSPVKESPARSPASGTPAQTLRLTHKRTLTPGPDPEPLPVFQPLRPAKSRNIKATVKVSLSNSPVPSTETPDTVRAPSSLTFGSRSSSRAGSKGSTDDLLNNQGSPIPTPVFKRAQGHVHQRPSRAPIPAGSEDSLGLANENNTYSIPIPPETRRMLGLSGTMGGSDVSGYAVPELDTSDPDSDVPDELRVILSGQSDAGDTISLPGSPIELPRSLASDPPVLDLPVFRAQLIDGDDNHADIDETGNSSEEDTKKSFDFTGEIQKLNESGGSDRRSFVEQLENAFRTPAKVDLHYGFGASLLGVNIPPVPKLPVPLNVDSSDGSTSLDSYSTSEIINMKEPTLLHLNMTTTDDSAESDPSKKFELYAASQILDIKEPTLLPGSDSLGSNDGTDDIIIDSDESASRNLKLSSSSRPSDGQLNTAFKFGGLPKASPTGQQEKPMTLSDAIPPLSHVRSLNSLSAGEDDSVLDSIFAKVSDIPQPRMRVNSDSSAKRRARDSLHYRHSRHSSGLSFGGFDSFDEVRRGFEFSNNRPPFYPPPAASRRANHGKHDSLFSIASVSSYGRVINAGSNDPFDYGLASLRERPSSEDMSISMSMSVDDTFSFLGRGPHRRRVDSDASSFYFKAPLHSFARGHRRHESNMSATSQAPPISLFNRSFGGHLRNDSSTSASSVAHSYAMYGANGGRAAWARHRQESSMDSVMSDFSMMRLGRPGVGDKMFDTALDHGVPLTAISASPSESLADQHFGNRTSFDYDSILDDDRRLSVEDSLFDKTGHRSSVSSDSVFGFDRSDELKGRLLPPVQFRPLSVLSINSVHSPVKEDDTMISMLGGGHVRRRSVHEFIEASPCVRIEKRKHAMFQYKGQDEHQDSPNKARIIEKPSIASTSSYTFGGERMIKAQRGLLERQSLEDSCLIADGEDITNSFQAMRVFSRPGPTTRSRSSTCTSISSGGDTPPLSSSDGFSSMSDGSQSSIDLSRVNLILANATHPMTTTARQRVRARARGHGHRRRASQAHASRSSVYETIEEEMSVTSSPNRSFASKKDSPTVCRPVFIAEPDTVSIDGSSPGQSIWDDERGIVALRKYYALRDEAQDTVIDSKRQWQDTPFSLFALQSFQPPHHPAGMKALLDYSVQNYGPLPSELRPRRIRSRTQSRPSPYPQARVAKIIPPSPEQKKQSNTETHRSFGTPVLQQVPVNNNIISVAPSLDTLKPFSPLTIDVEPKRENAFGLAPAARPRVGSTARRTALGWSKRSTGKSSTSSNDQKENMSQGMIMTPSESLRINRPRPRGRPTPASQQRPIRV